MGGGPRRSHNHLPSGRRDSNSRPSPWQGDALPTEPRPRAFRSAFPLPGDEKNFSGNRGQDKFRFPQVHPRGEMSAARRRRRTRRSTCPEGAEHAIRDGVFPGAIRSQPGHNRDVATPPGRPECVRRRVRSGAKRGARLVCIEAARVARWRGGDPGDTRENAERPRRRRGGGGVRPVRSSVGNCFARGGTLRPLRTRRRGFVGRRIVRGRLVRGRGVDREDHRARLRFGDRSGLRGVLGRCGFSC